MSVRAPSMYMGQYYNSGLDILTCERIMKCINPELEVIESLKDTIYDIPDEIILESTEKKLSVRDYMKSIGEDIEQYKAQLRDAQTKGVAFMYFSKRSILGDGVGGGKTVELASLLNVLESKGELTRAIIAVENVAPVQVQRELVRRTGMMFRALPSETPKMIKEINKIDWYRTKGLVIKHSTLKNSMFSTFLAHFLGDDGKSTMFNTFVLDESSVIKNSETQIADYSRNICNIVDRVHFLNATAFEKHIMDIYFQFDIINNELMPVVSKIRGRHCEFVDETFWRKGANGKGVQGRTRKLVGYLNQDELKNALKLVYFGKPSKKSEHIYMARTIMPTEKQMLLIAAGCRYQEVLNNPETINNSEQAFRYGHIPFDTKNVPKLAELVRVMNNEFRGQQVMVYCFYIKAQEVIKQLLEDEGYTCDILNGETKEKERDKIIERFNNREVQVIITNAKKSLNLHGGDGMIYYTIETNPAKLEQIRGRIDRNVDDRKKKYVMLIYSETQELHDLVNKVKQRSQDAKDLSIAADSAVDYFVEDLERQGKTQI